MLWIIVQFIYPWFPVRKTRRIPRHCLRFWIVWKSGNGGWNLWKGKATHKLLRRLHSETRHALRRHRDWAACKDLRHDWSVPWSRALEASRELDTTKRGCEWPGSRPWACCEYVWEASSLQFTSSFDRLHERQVRSWGENLLCANMAIIYTHRTLSISPES